MPRICSSQMLAPLYSLVHHAFHSTPLHNTYMRRGECRARDRSIPVHNRLLHVPANRTRFPSSPRSSGGYWHDLFLSNGYLHLPLGSCERDCRTGVGHARSRARLGSHRKILLAIPRHTEPPNYTTPPAHSPRNGGKSLVCGKGKTAAHTVRCLAALSDR